MGEDIAGVGAFLVLLCFAAVGLMMLSAFIVNAFGEIGIIGLVIVGFLFVMAVVYSPPVKPITYEKKPPVWDEGILEVEE